MSIFRDRLTALGFSSYEDYLQSEWWAEIKRKYGASKAPKVCAVCKRKKFQLHHVTYERLGCEVIGDLVPLCGKHHTAVHQWLKSNPKKRVEDSWEAIRSLRKKEIDAPAKKSPKKLAKRERQLKAKAEKKSAMAAEKKAKLDIVSSLIWLRSFQPDHAFWKMYRDFEKEPLGKLQFIYKKAQELKPEEVQESVGDVELEIRLIIRGLRPGRGK